MTSEAEGRRIVRERSNGVCEVCRAARATDFQHRQNRSQGGAWCPTTGLHVCHLCHMSMPHAPEKAMEMGWTVSRQDDPAMIPVYLDVWCGKGWYLLLDWGGYRPLEIDERPRVA